MKKQLITLVAGATLSMSALQAQAESYFGISFGSSEIDNEISNLTGTTSLDEKDSGVKIFYGFEITPKVALEFHYADLGESTLSGNNGDQFDYRGNTYQFVDTATLTRNADSFGVSGVYNFVDEGAFKPFVKVGLQRWSIDLKGPLADESVRRDFEDDGVDLFYGLGADIHVSKSVAIRLEYENYASDDGDYTLASLGANFKF